MSFPILTAQVCNNAKVFADILRLYSYHTDIIADVTYNTGAFWRASSPPGIWQQLWRSDLKATGDLVADFRCLPYRDESFDVIVLDPPYGRTSSSPRKDAIGRQYGLQTTGGVLEILRLYSLGMTEAGRVLKPKGILILKFQDQVSSGKQQRFSLWIGNLAKAMDYEDLDQFVVVQKRTPYMRHDYQIHARKNHSFFWVFRKRQIVLRPLPKPDPPSVTPTGAVSVQSKA